MKKNYIILLWKLAVIFTTLMAVTFLVMPFSSDIDNPHREKMLLITGVVFWGSLFVGYSAWIKAIIYIKDKDKTKRKLQIKFFNNIPKTIFDTTFFISLVWLIVLFVRAKNDYSLYVCIFIFIFSLNMHGLCSGNLFDKYIKTGKGEKKK